MSTPLHEIRAALMRAVPGVRIDIDEPAQPSGDWFMDVSYEGHSVGIVWNRERGLGVSSSALGEGYGEGPEEVYRTPGEVTSRVIDLLKNRRRTKPPREVLLRELRARFEITQEELAERLGVGQGSVSRMERRKDMTLSTLRKLIEAMGGELRVVARFPDDELVISQFSGKEEERSTKRSRASCSHVASELSKQEETDESENGDAGALASLESCLTVWARRLVGLAGGADPELRVLAYASDSQDDLLCERRDSVVRINVKATQRLIHSVFVRHDGSVVEGNIRTLALRRLRTSVPREQCIGTDLTTETCKWFVAHEVGHLMLDSLVSSAQTPKQAELSADCFAGWFDGILGRSPSIGAELFFALGCRHSTCTHPAPEARRSAYLEGHERGAESSRSHPIFGRLTQEQASRERHPPRLDATVLRVSDLERSRCFYSALGLKFSEERHGNGPAHFAAELPNALLELYPATSPSAQRNRLVLRVPSLDGVTERVTEHVPHGCWLTKRGTMVLHDPDGNEVELVGDERIGSLVPLRGSSFEFGVRQFGILAGRRRPIWHPADDDEPEKVSILGVASRMNGSRSHGERGRVPGCSLRGAPTSTAGRAEGSEHRP